MVLGIYGAGGLGREVLELAGVINERTNRWEDFIFIDAKPRDTVNAVKVYSDADAFARFSGNLEVAMGIGEPATRERLFAKLKDEGIEMATLIHPDVHIPKTTKIGKGVTIQAGCFVSCNVEIEDYVYVQPQVNIGHDDVLKEGCMLSGMSNLAGAVSVGRYSYVGLSSAIREGVSIGDYAIIGMYSAVYKDIPDEMIAMGNPARPMKKNEERHVFK
jgi:sugar O-acyltransferase (sialic acid O-acetyltransferase NeuD family)